MQKQWLITFAELATQRKSALKRIEIVFNPEFWRGLYSMEEIEDHDDPWDLMEEAKQAMRPGGIELIYTRLWTREDCLNEIRIAEQTPVDEHTRGQVDGVFV